MKKKRSFINTFRRDRKRFTKLLNPRIDYSKEFDIFSVIWGKKGIIDSTIELNLLREGDLRFDVTKDGIIVGIEVDNFLEVLDKFTGDKKWKKKKTTIERNQNYTKKQTKNLLEE